MALAFLWSPGFDTQALCSAGEGVLQLPRKVTWPHERNPLHPLRGTMGAAPVRKALSGCQRDPRQDFAQRIGGRGRRSCGPADGRPHGCSQSTHSHKVKHLHHDPPTPRPPDPPAKSGQLFSGDISEARKPGPTFGTPNLLVWLQSHPPLVPPWGRPTLRQSVIPKESHKAVQSCAQGHDGVLYSSSSVRLCMYREELDTGWQAVATN